MALTIGVCYPWWRLYIHGPRAHTALYKLTNRRNSWKVWLISRTSAEGRIGNASDLFAWCLLIFRASTPDINPGVHISPLFLSVRAERDSAARRATSRKSILLTFTEAHFYNTKCSDPTYHRGDFFHIAPSLRLSFHVNNYHQPNGALPILNNCYSRARLKSLKQQTVLTIVLLMPQAIKFAVCVVSGAHTCWREHIARNCM